MASGEQSTDARPLEDDPYPGEWIDCWNCEDGFIEDDDPFWPVTYRCDVCDGKGGWICEAVEASGER